MTITADFRTPEMDEQWLTHLANTSTGRVVITGKDDFSVVPVSYAVEHDRLVFQLGASRRKALSECDRLVFHADGIDPMSGNSWSVTIRGSFSSISGYGALSPPAGFTSTAPAWHDDEEASVWVRLRADEIEVRQSAQAV